MKCLAILLMIILITACSSVEPEYFVIVDTSFSNRSNLESADFTLTLAQVRQAAKWNDVTVVVAAAEPLFLEYEPNAFPEPKQVLEDLKNARLKQKIGEPPDERLAGLGINQNEYVWGYGTNLPAAIERVANSRDARTPAIVIAITDAYCEHYEAHRANSLRHLFSSGPTRLAVLGVSVKATGTDMTILDDLVNEMEQAGAGKFRPDSKLFETYYVSPMVVLPRSVLETPMRCNNG